jgi:hypothetical protein
MYYTEYRIYGINQDRFSFTTEKAEVKLSTREYADFRKTVAALPVQGLDPKTAASFGSIDMASRQFRVSASPDTEVRKIWQSLLDAFLKKHTAGKLQKTTKTIQGETAPPTDVSFAQLLKNPQAYDGKRIRITGYYHGEFEGSSFATSKAEIENYKQAVWLNGGSAFANPANLDERNNRVLTVEGTFTFGDGGHMGLWMGEISRTTYAQPTDLQATEAEDLYKSRYPTWRSNRGR